MKTLTERSINEHAKFIETAAQCDFNKLWTCTHPDTKGKKCTELCKNFTILGQQQNEV